MVIKSIITNLYIKWEYGLQGRVLKSLKMMWEFELLSEATEWQNSGLPA